MEQRREQRGGAHKEKGRENRGKEKRKREGTKKDRKRWKE